MLKVVLIDDEPNALVSLRWELERSCDDVVVLAAFERATEARDFLRDNPVDCIFLDIEMPDLNGFKLLEAFPERPFSVIVTTAFNQYAIKAIKEMALDYLLKPIDEAELKTAIEKARQTKNDKIARESKGKPVPVSPEFGATKKIGIPYEGKILFLNPAQITYCEGDGNYCYLFFDSGEKLFVTQQLKAIDAKLVGFNFFRIHNSYLVNMGKIAEYRRQQDVVVLVDGTELPVSRLKKAQFLNQF
ncbi:LytR/AlgR family response regulator transcription factor [Flavobacterium caeni]|uniref:Two component transcriptional regulator, LytTR family n=1 Tax=Flavobacterium caeni TaxID=490189 RepID=A0A1G5FDI4_9FLAO|nr:LytTR family DNA-binding domain-containing protein [Flavobacterium caeni]SCY37306.1 two component transcriptional regulator, LytTR family [Flavobacterium caeni]